MGLSVLGLTAACDRATDVSDTRSDPNGRQSVRQRTSTEVRWRVDTSPRQAGWLVGCDDGGVVAGLTGPLPKVVTINASGRQVARLDRLDRGGSLMCEGRSNTGTVLIYDATSRFREVQMSSLGVVREFTATLPLTVRATPHRLGWVCWDIEGRGWMLDTANGGYKGASPGPATGFVSAGGGLGIEAVARVDEEGICYYWTSPVDDGPSADLDVRGPLGPSVSPRSLDLVLGKGVGWVRELDGPSIARVDFEGNRVDVVYTRDDAVIAAMVYSVGRRRLLTAWMDVAIGARRADLMLFESAGEGLVLRGTWTLPIGGRVIELCFSGANDEFAVLAAGAEVVSIAVSDE